MFATCWISAFLGENTCKTHLCPQARVCCWLHYCTFLDILSSLNCCILCPVAALDCGNGIIASFLCFLRYLRNNCNQLLLHSHLLQKILQIFHSPPPAISQWAILFLQSIVAALIFSFFISLHNNLTYSIISRLLRISCCGGHC